MGIFFVALLAFLSSTEKEHGTDGAIRIAPAPIERASRALRTVHWLPKVRSEEHCLLLDEHGDARAVVSTRAIVGPLRQVYERDTVFAETGLRLHHTEEVTLIGGRRRLVWRELRPGGGRTWVVEWDSTGAKSTGYGWKRPVHETQSREEFERAVGPLELAYRLRTGDRVPGGEVRVVDPAASGVAKAQIKCSETGIRVDRSDSTLLFELGTGTVRFQDGPWVSRAIDSREAEQRRERWIIPIRPAHETVLAAIRGTR